MFYGIEQHDELSKIRLKHGPKHLIVFVQKLAKQARIHRRKKMIGTGRIENGFPHRHQVGCIWFVFELINARAQRAKHVIIRLIRDFVQFGTDAV